MAVAKFKSKIFDNPRDLEVFVVNDPSCSSVVTVISDNSGKYILFYMTP